MGKRDFFQCESSPLVGKAQCMERPCHTRTSLRKDAVSPLGLVFSVCARFFCKSIPARNSSSAGAAKYRAFISIHAEKGAEFYTLEYLL